jgi:hypothetical protein
MTSSIAMQAAERRDSARRAELVRAIPRQWRRRVAAEHAGRIARARQDRHEIARRYQIEREADEWLAARAGDVAGLRVPVDISDAELCEMAERCARTAMSLGEFAPGFHVADPAALRARLDAYVSGFGIDPPEGCDDAPALARMTSPLWWRRKLRVAQGRQLESAAIRLQLVCRESEPYASNATVARRTQQRQRNRAMLEQTEAINADTGEVVRLAALADATVANPRIRRGELMMRIAGFELIAREMGHVGEFVTITCPSRFHARRMAGAKSEPNPAHDGSTPKEAAGYLARIWSRIRAKLARLDIRPFGFRIAEPHHDGCPHWHMILFAARQQVQRMREVIREYAMQDSPSEPGAQEYRCKFVGIDMAKAGAAAGYVAKYISKNIDGGGYQVENDLVGDPVITASMRVEAWAAAWGIRQFQQVGGVPVGVWRELRRLPEGEYSAAVADARSAADCGPRSRRDGDGSATAENWARYVRVQGGAHVARADLAVTLAKSAEGMRFDRHSGAEIDAPKSMYGEPAKPRVYGVRDAATGDVFVSARDDWEIRRVPVPVESGRGDFWGSRTRGNNCTRQRAGFVELQSVVADRFSIFGKFMTLETGERGKVWRC